MNDDRENAEILRRAGLRSTPQRLAIAREVFSRRHPTAAEVFESVRRQFPTIGLATVYNTLRAMTEHGLVNELPFGNASRFDVNMTPHANLVCTKCGGIEDAEHEEQLLLELSTRVAARAGFAPVSQRLDIYGLCRRCSHASP
jgi:Fur family peroxide stress response transcriptional regulator